MTRAPKDRAKLAAPVPATSAAEALAELRRRGYDDASALSYAAAARSWTQPDSPERAVWRAVEAELWGRVT